MSEIGKRRVAVICGGRSGEHEISLRSARSVLAAIPRQRSEVTLIGIDLDGSWHLLEEADLTGIESISAVRAPEVVLVPRRGGHALMEIERPDRPLPKIDVIFPVLHGTFGEDGTIQGMLDMLDVPYVGAGVLGSAVGMDKDVQKRLLRDAGLPVVPSEVFSATRWQSERDALRSRCRDLGLPLFVKPANLGSSVGISKVLDFERLDAAVGAALEYDEKVLVERGVDAREIECAVLGNEEPACSVPGEIETGADFYSYDAKYSSTSTAKLLIPAPLEAEQAERFRSLAVRVFQVLECAGMARVDFLLDRGTGEIYVNEINTIPGFTSISMYPKLWGASGLSISDLVARLLDLAVERRARRNALRHGRQSVGA